MLIKQLRAATAGKYHIITEALADGIKVDCLDLQQQVVASRSLSAAQLQNKPLLAIVFADLKSVLNC